MADRPFIVGISGVPGSGKTTLIRMLLRDYPAADAISYDRFDPGMTDRQLQDWVQRGGDPNEMPLTELIGALARLARPDGPSRPLIFFETAFGRVHKASGAFIDLSVWIDTPLDLALSRANLVFIGNTARNPAPTAASDFISWLTRYMEVYPLLRRMYLATGERGSALADLVVDGSQPVEASVAFIRSAIVERL
jgi:uridine kinase